MEDRHCVRFLQWALPRLRMRWPGFRKVRKQVCKRIQRRVDELGLADIEAYRQLLQQETAEWSVLDRCCRVTISRFFRDRDMFEYIGTAVLPVLAESVVNADESLLHGWSAGCAMGEEAYSLVLTWDMMLSQRFPRLDIRVSGSDIDNAVLQRAARACYAYGSVKTVPAAWLRASFTRRGQEFCLNSNLRNRVEFIAQDIRDQLGHARFHIVFCRNLAFTYFDQEPQLEVLAQIHDRLVDGGALVIGSHENLPTGDTGFEPWSKHRSVFRKRMTSTR